MTTQALALAVIVLSSLFAVQTAKAELSYELVFFVQEGQAPLRIEVESEAVFAETLEYTESNNSLTISSDDFESLIEVFFVQAVFPNGRTESFDLRLGKPMSTGITKKIFFFEPGRFEDYADASRDNLRLLRTNRRKAFGPYFICRDSFAKAEELNDYQTRLVAAVCWIRANHRLVFADPSTTRKLMAPDMQAISTAIDIIEAISEDDDNWSPALERSIVDENEFDDLSLMIDELRLSSWLFFGDLKEVKESFGIETFCSALSSFQEAYQSTSQKERGIIRERFNLTEEKIFGSDADPTLVSLGQRCNPQATDI